MSQCRRNKGILIRKTRNKQEMGKNYKKTFRISPKINFQKTIHFLLTLSESRIDEQKRRK